MSVDSASCISFKVGHHFSRDFVSRDYYVNVVGPDMRGMGQPAAEAADVEDRGKYGFSPGPVQHKWWISENAFFSLAQPGIWSHEWLAIRIVFPADAAFLVAMEPGAISGERDEVCDGAFHFTHLQSKISFEIIPSATFVTGPVIVILKSSSILMSSWPPGMCTFISELHKPNRRVTAAAAQLLDPEARV